MKYHETSSCSKRINNKLKNKHIAVQFMYLSYLDSCRSSNAFARIIVNSPWSAPALKSDLCEYILFDILKLSGICLGMTIPQVAEQ